MSYENVPFLKRPLGITAFLYPNDLDAEHSNVPAPVLFERIIIDNSHYTTCMRSGRKSFNSSSAWSITNIISCYIDTHQSIANGGAIDSRNIQIALLSHIDLHTSIDLPFDREDVIVNYIHAFVVAMSVHHFIRHIPSEHINHVRTCIRENGRTNDIMRRSLFTLVNSIIRFDLPDQLIIGMCRNIVSIAMDKVTINPTAFAFDFILPLQHVVFTQSADGSIDKSLEFVLSNVKKQPTSFNPTPVNAQSSDLLFFPLPPSTSRDRPMLYANQALVPVTSVGMSSTPFVNHDDLLIMKSIALSWSNVTAANLPTDCASEHDMWRIILTFVHIGSLYDGFRYGMPYGVHIPTHYVRKTSNAQTSLYVGYALRTHPSSDPFNACIVHAASFIPPGPLVRRAIASFVSKFQPIASANTFDDIVHIVAGHFGTSLVANAMSIPAKVYGVIGMHNPSNACYLIASLHLILIAWRHMWEMFWRDDSDHLGPLAHVFHMSYDTREKLMDRSQMANIYTFLNTLVHSIDGASSLFDFPLHVRQNSSEVMFSMVLVPYMQTLTHEYTKRAKIERNINIDHRHMHILPYGVFIVYPGKNFDTILNASYDESFHGQMFVSVQSMASEHIASPSFDRTYTINELDENRVVLRTFKYKLNSIVIHIGFHYFCIKRTHIPRIFALVDDVRIAYYQYEALASFTNKYIWSNALLERIDV